MLLCIILFLSSLRTVITTARTVFPTTSITDPHHKHCSSQGTHQYSEHWAPFHRCCGRGTRSNLTLPTADTVGTLHTHVTHPSVTHVSELNCCKRGDRY